MQDNVARHNSNQTYRRRWQWQPPMIQMKLHPPESARGRGRHEHEAFRHREWTTFVKEWED